MSTAILSNEISSKVSAAFNFTVDKLPLSGPDNMRTPWYGLFRSDKGEVVGNGSVTSRYVPHQTDDVLALVEAVSEAFEGVADVNCYFREGHYVGIQPSKEERKAIFGTKDNIFPRVIIRAGYDGKAFSAAMGYYRDACANMHIMREVSGTVVTIRHTSGLRSKMDELISSFSVLHESWGTLAKVMEDMEAKKVSLVNFLKEVYGEPDSESPRAVTIHKNRTEDIFRRIMKERTQTGRLAIGGDFMVSVFEAFQSVQGYVQHEATRKSSSKNSAVTGFGRIIAATNDAAVIKAEKTAMALVA